MQELKLEKKAALKLIVDGKDYVLSRPTLGQLRRMESGGSSAHDSIINLLSELGLPTEVAEEIPVADALEIFEHITPKKKG